MCHVFVLTSAVGCSNCELAWPVIGHGRPYLAKVVYMFIFTLSSAAAGLSKAGLTLKVNACTTSMTDHPEQSMLTNRHGWAPTVLSDILHKLLLLLCYV